MELAAPIGIRREARLEAEALQELALIGDLLPHLGEKGGSVPSSLNDHPIYSWT
jgi:hypothetical protein